MDKVELWDNIILQLSSELDTYSYLHLCAFTMYYDSENIEEAKTNEGEANQQPDNKSVKCMDLILNTPYLFDNLDLNYQDRLGATVLHYLATIPGSEAFKMFEFLISKGSDFTLQDREKNSVIHYAIRSKNVSLIFLNIHR